MNIHVAAKYLEQGYRIRRRSWSNDMCTYLFQGTSHLWGYSTYSGRFSISFDLNDLLADDWEIITQGIIKQFPITYQE